MARFHRMIAISASHLPVEVHNVMTSHEAILAFEFPYGWLMWVPSDVEDSALWGPPLPEPVLRVQHYAPGLDCDWVLFDHDGDEESSLPTYPETDSTGRVAHEHQDDATTEGGLCDG